MKSWLHEKAQNAAPDDTAMVLRTDMDGLKAINDTFGHAEGDYGIRTVSNVVQSITSNDEILKTSRDPVSLDTPIGEEEDSQLGDFIEDESLLSPVDSASFSMLKEELEEAMASLTERERNVIKLRFGLDDGKTRTLEEVGKEFNVTRERIRQIEAKALRKLRHPSRSRKLKDFLE